MKFSLSGNQGLNIFAAGYLLSQQITCDTGAPLDDIEQTVTADNNILTAPAIDKGGDTCSRISQKTT